MVFRSHPMTEGALTEYLVTPAAMTFLMDDSMSYDCGAMIEPLSVGVHALQRGTVKMCDKIAIFGCGTIGLCTLMAAKAMGVSKVYMRDINSFRINLAKEYGADIVIDSSQSDFYKTVMDATQGFGVDGFLILLPTISHFQIAQGSQKEAAW